jgi:hypothetical protein
MEGEHRDPLAHLLDDALATYANQNPRPGLEQRVLNRIRAEGAPRVPLLRWALPVAAMGCLLAGIAVWNHRAPAPAPSERRTEASPPPANVATTEPAKLLRRQPKKLLRRQPENVHRARVPKEPEFPIRTPLTHQERALVAFVRSAPNQALQVFGETPPTKTEPLRIEEIQLEPLQIRDGAN